VIAGTKNAPATPRYGGTYYVGVTDLTTAVPEPVSFLMCSGAIVILGLSLSVERLANDSFSSTFQLRFWALSAAYSTRRATMGST